MARSDWNIEGVLFYVDEEGNQLDIYEYSDMVSPDLPIGHVALLLNLSRQRLVDVLNEPCTSNRHLITNYEESFRYENFIFNRFNVFREYSDVTVELLDFEYWLDYNYNLLKENRVTKKIKDKSIESVGLEQIRIELEQARQEQAVLQAELEKARYEAPPQGMTQQQRAALARSEKALNAWKPAIAAMIEIAVTIGKEGPKERQTPDLYVYFNERNIAITDEQMKFFRKALPSAYKDTEGGPVGKI